MIIASAVVHTPSTAQHYIHPLIHASGTWYTLQAQHNTTSTHSFMFPCAHPPTHYRVSSVLNRDVKQFGKKFMFDGDEETCWNSDQVQG